MSISAHHKRNILFISIIAGIITGGVAFPFVFYSLIKKYQIKMLKLLKNEVSSPLYDLGNISTPVAKRALCDRKDGATCYLNTALHLIGHIQEYRKYFDVSYQVIKDPQETQDHFLLRLKIQKKVNTLLYHILTGNGPVHGLGELIDLVKGAYSHETITRKASDVKVAISALVGCVRNKNEKDRFIFLLFSDEDLDTQLKELLHVHGWPKCFPVKHNEDKADAPRLELPVGSHRYRLEAVSVVISNIAHSVPLLYEKGSYYTFDDLRQHPQQIKTEDVGQYLKQHRFNRLFYRQY